MSVLVGESPTALNTYINANYNNLDSSPLVHVVNQQVNGQLPSSLSSSVLGTPAIAMALGTPALGVLTPQLGTPLHGTGTPKIGLPPLLFSSSGSSTSSSPATPLSTAGSPSPSPTPLIRMNSGTPSKGPSGSTRSIRMPSSRARGAGTENPADASTDNATHQPTSTSSSSSSTAPPAESKVVAHSFEDGRILSRVSPSIDQLTADNTYLMRLYRSTNTNGSASGGIKRPVPKKRKVKFAEDENEDDFDVLNPSVSDPTGPNSASTHPTTIASTQLLPPSTSLSSDPMSSPEQRVLVPPQLDADSALRVGINEIATMSTFGIVSPLSQSYPHPDSTSPTSPSDGQLSSRASPVCVVPLRLSLSNPTTTPSDPPCSSESTVSSDSHPVVTDTSGYDSTNNSAVGSTNGGSHNPFPLSSVNSDTITNHTETNNPIHSSSSPPTTVSVTTDRVRTQPLVIANSEEKGSVPSKQLAPSPRAGLAEQLARQPQKSALSNKAKSSYSRSLTASATSSAPSSTSDGTPHLHKPIATRQDVVQTAKNLGRYLVKDASVSPSLATASTESTGSSVVSGGSQQQQQQQQHQQQQQTRTSQKYGTMTATTSTLLYEEMHH